MPGLDWDLWVCLRPRSSVPGSSLAEKQGELAGSLGSRAHLGSHIM